MILLKPLLQIPRSRRFSFIFYLYFIKFKGVGMPTFFRRKVAFFERFRGGGEGLGVDKGRE
jgi:hypothetical protein